MSSIIPFDFNSNEIRVIEQDGEPWFIAKDVAELLGYSRSRDAIKQHCKGAVKHRLPTSSGDQEMMIIPERDLYRLIMRSKLPAAEAFEEWVVSEVLPSIRKTGSYGVQSIDFSDPQQIAGLLAQSLEKAQEQTKVIAELKPKAEALDRIAKADGSMCITDAAKDLQMRPKDLFAWLSFHKWIYKRVGGSGWVGYQDKLQQFVLEHKVTVVSRTDGSEKVTEQVRITSKGLTRLAKLVCNEKGEAA
jgi:anti-repressor protein